MASDPTPLVFLSSTSDLVAEREAVAEALSPPCRVYRFEADRAGGRSPHDRLVEVLEQAHVYLGVLGANWGSALPDDEQGRSIVEWEFDTARSREALHLMVFVRKGVRSPELDSRQAAFLDRVEGFFSGVWRKEFGSVDELVRGALQGLSQWLAEFWAAVGTAQRSLAARYQPRLLWCAAGFVGLALAGLGASTVLPMSRWALIGFLAMAAAAIGACAVLSSGIRGDDDG